MKTKAKIVLSGALLLALTSCAKNPVSGGQDFVMMSESEEVNIGRRADAQVRQQYAVYPSKALQDYVNSVGQKVAASSHRPNLTYHFTVVDSPEINAFALPGGYIYITRGILAYLNSEAELAAVLGHETGHVTARHGVRQQSAAQAANIGLTIASIFVPQINSIGGQNLSNLLGGALFAGYGREHELEADKLGADYLARSGYDPQAMIRVVAVLKNQELFDAEISKQEGREPRRYHGVFASHPDADTRLQQVVGEASQLKVVTPYIGHETYLRHTEGVTFNDSGDQGVVRNNQFMHADLGIALAFPADWRVQNLPDKLIATSANSDATLQLKTDAKPEGSPTDYLRRLAGSSASIEARDIHHLPAAVAVLNKAVLGVVYFKQQAYLIQGSAKTPEALAQQKQAMLNCIDSFHALSDAERKLVKPLNLHVITAKAGDTYAELAKQSPLGKNAESYLRLINAQYPSGEPVVGQLLKVID